MLTKQSTLMIAPALLMLIACGSNKNSTTSQISEDGTVQLFGAKVATSVSSLPPCDSTQVGQLFFVLADEEFQFCSTEGYQTIDLRGTDGMSGARGANGTNGTNGSNGIDGSDGADGSSCSVIANANGSKTILCDDGSTATVNNGASCTVTNNGDTSYDLTCSGTTVTVRDGIDGKNGIDGTDGADGTDGTNGTSCSVTDNGATLTQTCGSTSVSWPKAMCDDLAYNPATTFCVAQKLYQKCGTLTFDPESQFCSANTLWDLCDGMIFDPSKEFCDVGTNAPMLAWSAHCLLPGECGTFVDTRETPSKRYKWTRIMNQTWMAENLNFATTSGSFCDPIITNYCGTYGRAYNWETAKTACPTGWHLPTDEEWQTLEKNLGMNPIEAAAAGMRGTGQGTQMKASSELWTPNSGSNTSGFSALPGGMFDPVGSLMFNNHALWWTATPNNNTTYIRAVVSDDAKVLRIGDMGNSNMMSVRCLMN